MSIKVLGYRKYKLRNLWTISQQEKRNNTQHGNHLGIKKTSMRLFFVVAVVKKLYGHESLTFNDTVSWEVTS